MKKKAVIFTILLIIIILFTPSFSYAEINSSTDSSAPVFKRSLNISPAQRFADKKAEIQANRIEKLKEKANKEIERRLASLNKLIEKLNKIKRLSSGQKVSLINQIQTQINDLASLKSKIELDTDLETLKTDVQPIVKSYRIYLLFIPKIHILSAADVMQNTADKLNELAAKLQTRINDAKNADKNVSSLELLLTDMQNKIIDAKKQATDAQDAVLPLTPDGYPDNKTTLQSARKMLQTGKHDLAQARIDAKKIVNGLKTFKVKTNISETTASSSSE